MSDELRLTPERALRELLDRTSLASREFVEWVTVPIAGNKPGVYGMHRGTGVLLQIGDCHFLLTAAHVLQAIQRAGENPFIVFPYKTELPVALAYELIAESNHVDVAVALLDEQIVERLKAHYQFMQLSNVWSPKEDLGFLPSFMLTGYAGDRVRRDTDGSKFCDPWGFRTGLHERQEVLPGYDPDRHWVLGYPDQIMLGCDGRGYNIDPPGMSGCGVWAILQMHDIEMWTAKNLKLAGLLLEWSEAGQFVVGTKIAVPLYMIWCHFPQTREALHDFGVSFQLPDNLVPNP